MNNNDTVKIGISGSYGGMNLGDEAILQSIINGVRSNVDAEITVFSRNPEDTLGRHKVERAVPVRKLGRKEIQPEIERLELLIIGGGGILYDADAKTYLREAVIAHEIGVPFMIYAVGAGPLNDHAVQEHVRTVLDFASVVTVRDHPSLRVLEEAGVKREIIITADPALLLTPEPLNAEVLQSEGITSKRKLVGLSVREPGVAAPDIREEHYHNLIANAADYLIDRYDFDVVFIPMEPKFDLHQAHSVIAKMVWPNHASILQGDYSPGQIMTIMKRFDFVVGMRLHFLIFAALQGIPFISLPYAKKVLGFLEELKVEMPPFHDITPGRLIAYIDKSWDRHREIQELSQKLLPNLQQRAAQNNILMTEVLRLAMTRKGVSPELLKRRANE